MSEPEIAAKKPAVLPVAAGTHFWCACGRSAQQPYCDGSHKGTGISPLKFEVSEPATMALCLCKHSGTKPTCDGSHKRL